MFKRYIELCGVRSAIFQALCLTWLVMCALIFAAIVLLGPSDWALVNYHRFTMLSGVVCSGSLCLLGCLPLLVAAVATIKS